MVKSLETYWTFDMRTRANFFTRPLLFSFAYVLTLLGSSVSAQVVVKTNDAGFILQNRSGSTLLDLIRGESRIDALNPGSSWENEHRPAKDLWGQDLPLELNGRIDLNTWQDSFHELPGDEIWARLNLQTAGINIHRNNQSLSLFGAPTLADNILNLRRVTPEVSSAWASGEGLQLGLISYAARYIPSGLLLKSLLNKISPQSPPEDWPKGYETLPSTRDSIRAAIEIQGRVALPILLSNESWSKDRGFNEPQLAFALGDEEELIAALEERAEGASAMISARFKEDKRLCDDLGVNAAAGPLKLLIETRKAGDVDQALSLSTQVALMWRRHNMSPEEGQATQIVCGHLDWGAQRAINEKQTLAAEAYLTLAQGICHGVPYFRSRAAEFMRTKGDQAFFSSDFQSAQHWYRAAVWLSDEILDRVRLIDTLSQLSLIYLVQGEVLEAQTLLKEARSFESPTVPPRESLLMAYNMMPQADHRAQLGLIVLIVILSITVILQLAKVLFGLGKKRKA